MEKHSSSWLWGVLFSVCGVMLSPHRVSAAHSDGTRTASWLVEDRAIAASQLESEATLSSLYRAILLRRSLDETDAASADISRLLSLLTERLRNPPLSDGDREVLESFFEYVLSDEPWTDTVAWTDTLRRLIAVLRDGNQPELSFRAEVRLAAHLWKQSCPIEGQDGACIMRKDAQTVCRSEQNVKAERLQRLCPKGRIVKPHRERLYYQYETINRKKHTANEAQILLQNAMARSTKIAMNSTSPALREAISHARFLLAEPSFEKALSQAAWPGAPSSIPSGTHRQKSVDQIYFNRWLSLRFQNLSRPTKQVNSLPQSAQWQVKQYSNYVAILNGDATRWTAAAQSRLGMLALDAGNQLEGCIHPVMIFQDTREFNWISCDKDGIQEPLIDLAKQHFATCAELATKLLIEGPIIEFCTDAHDRISTNWIGVHEIIQKPTSEYRYNPEKMSLIE